MFYCHPSNNQVTLKGALRETVEGVKNTTFQGEERSRGKLPREMSVGNVNRCSSLQPLPCRGLARRPVAMQHWALPASIAADCARPCPRAAPCGGTRWLCLTNCSTERNFPQKLCPGGAPSRHRLIFSLNRAPFLYRHLLIHKTIWGLCEGCLALSGAAETRPAHTEANCRAGSLRWIPAYF